MFAFSYMKKIIAISIMLCLLIASAAFIVFYFENETQEMKSQEIVSQETAEQYIISMLQEERDSDIGETSESHSSDLDYNDNDIYGRYSEKNAWGFVDCVLEIPTIDLRQSIYTGEPDQIEHDLSNWLSVTARSDYILGATHYCIYMHNPRDGSIKISKAQYDLNINDYMIVTKNQFVYLYRVSDIFPEWRNKCTDKYVNNMATDSSKLYIFTCARNEWAGRNLVVEGEVYKIYQLKDWVDNKEQYILDFKKDMGTIENSEYVPESINMTLRSENNQIIAELSTNSFKVVDFCSIGVVDADGRLVESFENPIAYNGEPIKIPQLPVGQYYIGVYENDSEYLDPNPYFVDIDSKTYTTTITTVTEDAEMQDSSDQMMKTVALISLGVAFLFGSVILIKSIVSYTKEKREDEA